MLKKLLVVSAMLAMASMASAAIISVSSLTLPENGTGQVTVTVSGITGTQVNTMDFLAIIGMPADFGLGTDTSPPAPAVTGGSLGAIWGAAANQFDNTLGPMVAKNAAVLNAGSFASDGVAFVFDVKANTQGSWPIWIATGDTKFNGVPLDSRTGDVLNNGVLTVTPEPAALALLGIGAMFIRRRR